MTIVIKTMIPWGVDGRLISIEIDNNKSLPWIDIIWLPDSAVRESRERLRSTFRSCDIDIPPHKFVVNLSPSDIKKSGALFDVPIATGLLAHILWKKTYHQDIIQKSIFIGELWLDWSVKPINWVLSIVISAKKEGFTHFFVPKDNEHEIWCIADIVIHPLTHFTDIKYFLVDGISNWYTSSWLIKKELYLDTSYGDFDDIQWHDIVKRAIAIGAVGMHNILMIGPPGTGKSIIAKAIPWVLPPMWHDEIIAVSQIYSLSGGSHTQHPLVVQRPFRSIHHTASKISLIGGWQKMSPGEISHAHNGVLFLDEIAEFPRDVLDVLRQPIEDKCVTISRAQWTITYPADCMVVWAMNPCICGYYKDEEKICICAPNSVKKYQNKISWPLLDRFDIIIEVKREYIWKDKSSLSITSNSMRENIMKAWDIQQQRYQHTAIRSNSQLGWKDIKKYIVLDNECEELLLVAQKKLSLSHRWVHRILKVSRTIADYEWSEHIQKQHLLEALQYRVREI
jgi:magnesium chelatase family protein